MIFERPDSGSRLDQGDIIDDCPVTSVVNHDVNQPSTSLAKVNLHRIIVLTQACDLANDKITSVNVAVCFDAPSVVAQGLVKPADLKGPIRSGRVWGLYFLPADPVLGLPEMLLDLRKLHTLRIEVIHSLLLANKRRARLPTPYREHLAKHFADTFSRIGLPRPYETL